MQWLTRSKVCPDPSQQVQCACDVQASERLLTSVVKEVSVWEPAGLVSTLHLLHVALVRSNATAGHQEQVRDSAALMTSKGLLMFGARHERNPVTSHHLIKGQKAAEHAACRLARLMLRLADFLQLDHAQLVAGVDNATLQAPLMQPFAHACSNI